MIPILPNLAAILARQQAKGTVPSPWGPDWKWDWGWRVHPITNEKKWHNGIDLPAPTGTPVFSPWDGIVTHYANGKVNGNYIKISHDPQYAEGIKETAYAHLHKVHVKVGDPVAAGQKVAEVGSTGRSTGPHLHFITRGATKTYAGGMNRRDTDPLPFLQKKNGETIVTSFGLLAILLYVWYSQH